MEDAALAGCSAAVMIKVVRVVIALVDVERKESRQ
jgi:hypothetical protein